MGGFTGPVTMTVTSITDPNGTAVANPSSWATFQSSGKTSSTGIVITASPFDTLNVQAPPSALAGDYTINITGTDSSGNTTTLSIDLNVIAGFSVVPNPAALYIAPGASGTATISVDAVGTETGTVTLTSAATDELGTSVAGITATFAGSSVAIGGSSIATVKVASGTAPGTYELNITGTDAGGNTSEATIQVIVQTGSFTINPALPFLSMPAGSAPQTDVVTVSPIGVFTGAVSLSASIAGSSGTDQVAGLTAIFATPSVTLPTTNTDTLTITAKDVPVGEYTVNITGTDSSGNTATAQVEVDVTAGFTLNASPQSLTIPPGGSNTSSITAAAAGSESGSLTLFSKIFGDNGLVTDGSVAVSFSPSSITIGGSTPSIATVSVGPKVATGSTYSIWIYGRDAGGTKSGTPISLTVGTPTLKLRTNPTVSVAAGGSSVTQSVVVKPSGGLQGNVVLSVSIVPSAGGTAPTGLSVSFSPSSATIDANDDKLTFSTVISATSSVPDGTYVATITGTDGAVTGTTTVTITVSAMTLSVSDTGYQPTNPNRGETVADTLTATLSPALTGSESVSYAWSQGPVWYSSTDISNSFAIDENGDYSLGWQGGPPSDPTESPTGPVAYMADQFNSYGYYVVEVTCVATITSGSNTTTLSGVFYVGGIPSDVESTSSSIPNMALVAAASAAASTTNSHGPPIPLKATPSPYIIFVHGITQGTFWPDKFPGVGHQAENDWSDDEKKAVASTVGDKVPYSEFSWSGDIGFQWIVQGWPDGGPCGDLSNKIARLTQLHSVILVGHSAGGCVCVATAAGMQVMNKKGPTMIIRLDSPPMDRPYSKPPCPVFDAMDPWDLCVMDYARWNIKYCAAYGVTLPVPSKFPTLDGLNPEFSSHRFKAYDPTEKLMPSSYQYLTLSQFLVDLTDQNTLPFATDAFVCNKAVTIHLDAMGKAYWGQLNAAWQADIRSLLK
jgi:hypothetical protein